LPFGPLVDAAWLRAHIDDGDLWVIDFRWYLAGRNGREEYGRGHIPRAVFVEVEDGAAVMIGDAAYTSDIYREADQADLSSWPGQHSNRRDWSRSLKKVHAMEPREVHFCHDTRVVR